SRMWLSSWWVQTPGWTRNKRRIRARRQPGPEAKHDHIRAGSAAPYLCIGVELLAAAIMVMPRPSTQLVAGQYAFCPAHRNDKLETTRRVVTPAINLRDRGRNR